MAVTGEMLYDTSVDLISPSNNSAASNSTLRGVTLNASPGSLPATPSYPFPRMANVSKSAKEFTDVQTQFVPFTALSPTTEPPSIKLGKAKLAKAKLAHDFKTSGHVRQATDAVTNFSRSGNLPGLPPDSMRIALRLQKEPGLKAWWIAICAIVKEHFRAERASLAVPSDIADVENVPWVQLATFQNDSGDNLSRVANARKTETSNLTEASFPDSTTQARDPPKPGFPKSDSIFTRESRVSPTTDGATKSTNRPKLEQRHSYAGYPVIDRNSEHSGLSSQTKSYGKRPRISRISSSTAASRQPDLTLDLNEKTLELHDQAYEDSSFSPPVNSKTTEPILWDVVRPLEAEADALIDSSGVFKVMRRGAPVLLTRQYKNIAQDLFEESQEAPYSQGITLNRQQTRPGPAARAKSLATKSTLRTLDEAPGQSQQQAVYDDYEQVAQSPWSLSPAPSPTARVETGENPFFPSSGAVDEAAFEDSGQTTEAASNVKSGIPAIGIDNSSTIVQIPLFHHSSPRITQLDPKSMRSASTSAFSPSQDEQTPSGSRYSQAPQAILSVLIPVVPYPFHLLQSLNELAPLFAATLLSARQYTNMARQLESFTNRRRISSGIISDLSFETGSRSPLTSDSSPADKFGDVRRPFSPGVDSLSGRSRPASVVSDSRTDRASFPTTPSLVTIVNNDDANHKSPGAATGKSSDLRQDYFSHSALSGKEVLRSDPPLKASSDKRTVGKDELSKIKLQSEGADFAATHPALPISTSSRGVAVSTSSDPQAAVLDTQARRVEPKLQSFASIKPSVSMLQTMIDNGAAQQWIAAGASGVILWANAKFLVYRQSSGNDLDAEFWGSIIPKERQAFKSAWSSAFRAGEQFSRNCRLRRFNGQYRWFSIRIIPIKDRQGATKFFHGQAMDIHDQREAERSMHRAKEHRKYRTLANSIPVIVLAAHVPTGVTYANSQWLSYSGQSEDEYKGFGFLDHIHPDDLTKCRFPGFEGDSWPVADRDSRQPLYRYDSSTSNASSTAESEDTVATEATAQPLIHSPAESDTSDTGNILRQLAREGIVEYEKDEQGHISITTEMRLKSKTGEYRWHLVSGSYIDSVDFGSGDAPAQWFLTATDITNQKLTESRIADAKSALESANSKLALEVKSKMSHLSSMSHEIRTPLNGIIGNLQFLINSGLADEAYSWAHDAKDAATNMSELINDILDLSKAEAKMLTLASHSFSPREISENILDQLNSRVSEQQLEISLEIDPRVPRSLKGDSGRIRQILLNLVSNAIKFTSEGEIWIHCDLMTTPQFDLPKLSDNECFVQWSVSDSGKGFTEADKDLLFKEYSQIKKRRDRDIGGTGLGLILCRTMVELHGGRIDASSEPGRGATFTFFARFKLPKTKVKASALPTPKSATVKVGLNASDPINESPLTSAEATDSSPLRTVLSYTSEDASSLNNTVGVAPAQISSGSMSSPIWPAPSPASSSVVSSTSTNVVRSKRSSSSTSHSEIHAAPMNLTLPTREGKTAIANGSSRLSHEQHVRAISEGLTPGYDGITFRPPVYSILLYCPSSEARRVTASQIRRVIPQAVPCQLSSKSQLDKALESIDQATATTFTHIVVRTVVNEDALKVVIRVLESEYHQQVFLLLITSQAQLSWITAQRPDFDIQSLKKRERLLVIQRPCHSYKLSRIFDPLRENEAMAEDPQMAKRREEKRLQQESYALFRKRLGDRNHRVLAVEDNKVAMGVLVNFLGKICGLEVAKASNGQEGLDALKAHPAGYFSAVVSDIEMPIMGGYEMVRELRKWEASRGWSPTPTVSLSANTVREGWMASAEAGFTHFTPKPINFTDLGNVLLEITQADVPHTFLRDRPLPKELSGERDDSSDDDSEEEQDTL